MPYCWKCGTELKEGARFCHKCGAPARHARKEKERPWWEELEDSFEDFGERMEKWWEELWD
ncbi:MAG: zinc ribbon domain-containing protein [Candidatus Bathyarchaeota archaeon]|nr:zinc ribbon domain-containing protein [Candidatus Bathyarchaeota archaeon]